MSGGIFLIQKDDQLIEMNEQPYDSEGLLQGLLTKYPNLLAGRQINAEAPRRWLLIAREMGIPGEEEGGDRWSLDHLFLDQDGIPTLVEVKRSSDTRIRREVVGQMLDYAANALTYWDVERLSAHFEANCEKEGLDPAERIAELLGQEGDTDVDAFWGRVKDNLRAGKLRMVFMADEIPDELQRIVEFLNRQMDPAEVLAVEIRQYVGQDLRTMVPRVIGQIAEQKTASLKQRQWDEPSFLEEIRRRFGADVEGTVTSIVDWAKDRGLRVWWGRGNKDGSFLPMVDHKGLPHWLFSMWTYGRVEIQFQHMGKPPFSADSKRLELVQRLNRIPGVNIPQDAIRRRPSFPISVLSENAMLNQFLGVFDWVIEEIKAT